MTAIHVLLQVIVGGILVGGLYGLFSSGLSLIFGITRVVNFAHGDFVTMGMYGAFFAFTALGMNPLAALLPVAALMFLLGILVYAVVLRRTTVSPREQVGDSHAQLVLTLALSILFENAMELAFSPNPDAISGVMAHTYHVGAIYINETQLVAFLVALVFFGALYALLNFTGFGRAVQATVDDADMAAMVGIDTRKIYAVNFGIGVALAAVAGAVLILYFPVTPTTGASLLVIAFVVVVLGGLGNVVGAFLAGLLIGVVQAATATYVALDLQNVGVFLAFILVLLFRPQGLWGRGLAR
ncbi:MAG: branched-chain amino acid ABC transporter permease [Actinomycetia bacterium]|nr:branched-chain amino acid ABC transporter permease [Actinomycetes bacterium]